MARVTAANTTQAGIAQELQAKAEAEARAWQERAERAEALLGRIALGTAHGRGEYHDRICDCIITAIEATLDASGISPGAAGKEARA